MKDESRIRIKTNRKRIQEYVTKQPYYKAFPLKPHASSVPPWFKDAGYTIHESAAPGLYMVIRTDEFNHVDYSLAVREESYIMLVDGILMVCPETIFDRLFKKSRKEDL